MFQLRLLSRTAEEAQAALENDVPLNQPTNYPSRAEKRNIRTRDPASAHGSWEAAGEAASGPATGPFFIERPGLPTAPRRHPLVPLTVSEPAGAGRSAAAPKHQLVVFAPRKRHGAAEWEVGAFEN